MPPAVKIAACRREGTIAVLSRFEHSMVAIVETTMRPVILVPNFASVAKDLAVISSIHVQ